VPAPPAAFATPRASSPGPCQPSARRCACSPAAAGAGAHLPGAGLRHSAPRPRAGGRPCARGGGDWEFRPLLERAGRDRDTAGDSPGTTGSATSQRRGARWRWAASSARVELAGDLSPFAALLGGARHPSGERMHVGLGWWRFRRRGRAYTKFAGPGSSPMSRCSAKGGRGRIGSGSLATGMGWRVMSRHGSCMHTVYLTKSVPGQKAILAG